MNPLTRIWFLLFLGFGFPVMAQNLKLNDAFLKIQDVLTKDPENPDRQMDLAYIFSEGGEIDKAIGIYQNVLKGSPQNLRAATELCALSTQVFDKPEAKRACELAASIAPQDALMWDNLGLSYFKLGDAIRSLEPFHKGLALTKDNSLIRSHMAQAYLSLGEAKLAESVFRVLTSNDKLNADVRVVSFYGLSQALRLQKKYDEAYQAINGAYQLSENPLYLGKCITAWMVAHQWLMFVFFSLIMLLSSRYFGERLNRFLKNE
jgi:Tfp pilus assembly protein PilF